MHPGSASGDRQLRLREDREVRGFSIHSFRATQVDGTSSVLNGSVTNGHEPAALRFHGMDNGSVANNSTVVNGDLTLDEFRRIFCSGR